MVQLAFSGIWTAGVVYVLFLVAFRIKAVSSIVHYLLQPIAPTNPSHASV